MNTLIHTLRDRAAKRQAYKTTVGELRRMPLDVALDLNIHRGDAEKIARTAVYGV